MVRFPQKLPPFINGERQVAFGVFLPNQKEAIRASVIEFAKPTSPSKRYVLQNRLLGTPIAFSDDSLELLDQIFPEKYFRLE